MNYEKNVILRHLLNALHNHTNATERNAVVASINRLEEEGIDFTQLTKQSRQNLQLGAKFLAQLAFPNNAIKYYTPYYQALIVAKQEIIDDYKKIHKNKLD